MSVFNLNIQNENTDNKIVAGLEKLSQVFKLLLWEKSKNYGLSPLQIQTLIFIQYHPHAINKTVSYLAGEFNVTKPTISDAVKILEQKRLITKVFSTRDNRSYNIAITAAGQNIVELTDDFANPLLDIISCMSYDDKETFWKNIVSLITLLHKTNIISVQRTCTACTHFALKEDVTYCKLLNQRLEIKDIRIDCPEYFPAAIV